MATIRGYVFARNGAAFPWSPIAMGELEGEGALVAVKAAMADELRKHAQVWVTAKRELMATVYAKGEKSWRLLCERHIIGTETTKDTF